MNFSQKYLEEMGVDIANRRACGRLKEWGQAGEDCFMIHFSQVKLILAPLKLLQCRNQHGSALAT